MIYSVMRENSTNSVVQDALSGACDSTKMIRFIFEMINCLGGIPVFLWGAHSCFVVCILNPV